MNLTKKGVNLKFSKIYFEKSFSKRQKSAVEGENRENWLEHSGMLNFPTWEPEFLFLFSSKLVQIVTPQQNQKIGIFCHRIWIFCHRFLQISPNLITSPKKEFARFRQAHSIKSGVRFVPEFLTVLREFSKNLSPPWRVKSFLEWSSLDDTS